MWIPHFIIAFFKHIPRKQFLYAAGLLLLLRIIKDKDRLTDPIFIITAPLAAMAGSLAMLYFVFIVWYTFFCFMIAKHDRSYRQPIYGVFLNRQSFAKFTDIVTGDDESRDDKQ